MPLIISVPVDIPATRTINYDVLQKELARYAQDIVDSNEDELEVLSSTELAQHTISVDSLRKDLHSFVSEQYQKRIV